MLRNYQNTNTDKHDESRNDNAILIRTKQLTAIGIFVLTTLGHKNCIVISLSKDKGCQNDIDNVKLNTKNRHNA